MSAAGVGVAMRPVRREELDAVLELIADYQRFYGAAQSDPQRNREFFAAFLRPSERGELLGAWDGGRLAGYACLYWTYSSTQAEPVVLLNDLFVAEEHRGAGTGLALIEAARAVARERGARRVTWQTALDNRRAQRLYESTGARRSAWFEYELDA